MWGALWQSHQRGILEWLTQPVTTSTVLQIYCLLPFTKSDLWNQPQLNAVQFAAWEETDMTSQQNKSSITYKDPTSERLTLCKFSDASRQLLLLVTCHLWDHPTQLQRSRARDTEGAGELEPPTFQANLHIQHTHPTTINWVIAEVRRHSACSKQKG